MYIIQPLLLALLTFFFSTALFAQIDTVIIINGIDKPQEANVRLLLSIEQQKDHPFMTEGRLRSLHKKAPQEITKALRPFGYYQPVIDSKISKTSTDGKLNQWQLIYNINPGAPLLVSQFDFTLSEEMRNDESFQTLLKQLPLREGEIFNHVVYDNFKSSLAKIAAERGYFSARFIEHRIEIDIDRYEARVQLNYQGGPRYRFGEVTLDQNVLDPGLLQRYIPFEKGAPYSLNLLIELQRSLNDSDYFQTVEVMPGKVQISSNEIPITVKLTPRKKHRFNIGLGFGTDTGARANFAWEMPRINTYGHRFNTDLNVSEIGYSAIAHYRIPVLNPRTDQLIYSTGIVNESTDTSESTLRSVGVSLKRTRDEWRESISLNYQREDFVVADDRGKSILLIPGINWSRTWGNSFIYAIDGLRFDIDLRGATEEIVSDTSFSQINGKIKFISSLNKRNRFISRGTFGSTWTEEFHELPTSVRFFAGGTQSVRGYAYNSLGPLDANAQVIGGKYLVEGSIEFEHSFKNKWGLAVFYDVGNAINNLNDDLAHGVGFGFRWKSPVGPIRVDLASALSHDGNPWRIHISIGPDL